MEEASAAPRGPMPRGKRANNSTTIDCGWAWKASNQLVVGLLFFCLFLHYGLEASPLAFFNHFMIVGLSRSFLFFSISFQRKQTAQLRSTLTNQLSFLSGPNPKRKRRERQLRIIFQYSICFHLFIIYFINLIHELILSSIFSIDR